MLFITYNRLPYVQMSLPSLLAGSEDDFALTIWDNGSTDGTREYLSSVKDPRLVRTVFSQENVRLHGAVNDVVGKSKADLFGVVFDDFILTPGWTTILAKAHADVPEFGLVECWYFEPEEFDYERCRNKIQTFGAHQVLRHPWNGVGAGLVKVKTMREIGPLESSRTTYYWIRMAQRGYVNGWYYPPVYVEHIDYPWSKHFAYKDRFNEWLAISSGAKAHGMRTLQDVKKWHQVVLANVMDDPWDVKYYVGWRGKLRRGKDKLRRMLTGSRF
jgi:glycosyltransferase involved in cell wall biosynthesis